jgi:hypothetical protein
MIKQMTTLEEHGEGFTIRNYWDIVGSMRCLITDSPIITLHHCHGGSMNGIGMRGKRGLSQKPSDWLVIPIAAEYHFGAKGIDTGHMTVEEWEKKYGTQYEMINELIRLTGINVWSKVLTG